MKDEDIRVATYGTSADRLVRQALLRDLLLRDVVDQSRRLAAPRLALGVPPMKKRPKRSSAACEHQVGDCLRDREVDRADVIILVLHESVVDRRCRVRTRSHGTRSASVLNVRSARLTPLPRFGPVKYAISCKPNVAE